MRTARETRKREETRKKTKKGRGGESDSGARGQGLTRCKMLLVFGGYGVQKRIWSIGAGWIAPERREYRTDMTNCAHGQTVRAPGAPQHEQTVRAPRRPPTWTNCAGPPAPPNMNKLCGLQRRRGDIVKLSETFPFPSSFLQKTRLLPGSLEVRNPSDGDSDIEEDMGFNVRASSHVRLHHWLWLLCRS